MKSNSISNNHSALLFNSRPLTIAVQVVVGLAFFFFAYAANAQEVYNFYFQKAPGATNPTINTTTGTPSITTTTDANGNVTATTASPPLSVSAGGTSTPLSVSTSANSELKSSDPLARWSVQIMRTLVADAYSDAYRGTGNRLGIQVGHRLNKYFGSEFGAAFGALEGNWAATTGADFSKSIVPYIGIRANPIHLNVFGSEFLEFYATAGAVYIDRSHVGMDGGRNTYGYLGGGMRTNINSTLGFEIHAKTIAGDTRYGVGGMGIDVRF